MKRRIALALVVVLAAMGLASCKHTTGPMLSYGGVVICGSAIVDVAGKGTPLGHGGVAARWGSCEGESAPTAMQIRVQLWWHPTAHMNVLCAETGWVGGTQDTPGFTVTTPNPVFNCDDIAPGDRFSTEIQVAARFNSPTEGPFWVESGWAKSEWEEWTLP